MSSGRPGRTAIKRPRAGIAIDRGSLIRMRQAKLISRAQLARMMSNGPCPLCGQPYGHALDCPNFDEYSITPDAIAKIENGWRRPKVITLDRMCRALGCVPEDLLAAADDDADAESCNDCKGLYGHEPGCQDDP